MWHCFCADGCPCDASDAAVVAGGIEGEYTGYAGAEFAGTGDGGYAGSDADTGRYAGTEGDDQGIYDR